MTTIDEDIPPSVSEERYRQDVCHVLSRELAGWFGKMAQQGILPRAFTGVTAAGRQMVIVLSGLPFDHVQRREFLIWLCREERIAAYVYASHVLSKDAETDDVRELLSFQASSDRINSTVDFDVHRDEHGAFHFQIRSLHAFEAQIAEDQFLFHGLQRKQDVISDEAAALYTSVWHEQKGRCLWRDRHPRPH